MMSKQEKIVNQFIKDVPKFGWSRDTLLGSAKKLKVSTSNLAKEFPGFETDIIKFIISQNNKKVEKLYKSFNHDRLRMRDRIKTILELKFETNQHLKDSLPEMLKNLLRPGNILSSLKLLNQNSDFHLDLSSPLTPYALPFPFTIQHLFTYQLLYIGSMIVQIK